MDDRSAGPGAIVRAGLRTRVVASLVDLGIVVVISLVVLLVVRDAPVAVRLGGFLLASGLTTYVPEVVVGRSAGKAALQLRHARPGEDLPALPAFLLRYAMKWLVPAILVAIGLWTWAVIAWVVDGLPMLVGDGRALHDLAAGTRVWQTLTTQR